MPKKPAELYIPLYEDQKYLFLNFKGDQGTRIMQEAFRYCFDGGERTDNFSDDPDIVGIGNYLVERYALAVQKGREVNASKGKRYPEKEVPKLNATTPDNDEGSEERERLQKLLREP